MNVLNQRIESLREEAKRVLDNADVKSFDYDDKSYSSFIDETVKLTYGDLIISINRQTKKEKKY